MPRIPHAGERFLAALGCARRGIPVIPLHHPVTFGRPPAVACSCQEPDCPRAGAHPMTLHGVADATIDPIRLTWWWRRFPEANLGLATGVGFDVLVVHGSEGDAVRWSVVAEALRAGGPLVRTGGDGWHFYFAPTGAPGQRPHGLARTQWRGLGDWVVAPPSRHASGAVSAWVRDLDAPLPAAPDAVLERLLEPAGPAWPESPPAGPVLPASYAGSAALAGTTGPSPHSCPSSRVGIPWHALYTHRHLAHTVSVRGTSQARQVHRSAWW